MAFGPEENKNREACTTLGTIEAALSHQNARAAPPPPPLRVGSDLLREEVSSGGAVMLADAFARYGDLKQYRFFFFALLDSL